MHAVAEAARKVACTGATPVAATNCLNFGNPEKPEIMRQLSDAIDGIAEACTTLGTPITGGNVSLYNETRGEGIYPTPVLGVVGILEDVSKAVPSDFQSEGDAIVLLTLPSGSAGIELLQEFGSSEYARSIYGELWGTPPRVDLADEKQLTQCLAALSTSGLVKSVRDISDGGLATTLAEATFSNGIGAHVKLQPYVTELNYPDVCRLFAEESTQVILTCAPRDFEAVKEIAEGFGFLTVVQLGETGGKNLEIAIGDRSLVSARVDDLKQPWSESLKAALHDHTASEVLA
jgi:phosphoribosylformylglycinamidine synthase